VIVEPRGFGNPVNAIACGLAFAKTFGGRPLPAGAHGCPGGMQSTFRARTVDARSSNPYSNAENQGIC